MINLQRINDLMSELEGELRQSDNDGALAFKDAVALSRHLVFLHHEVIRRYVDRAPDAPDEPTPPRLEFTYSYKRLPETWYYPIVRDALIIALLIILLILVRGQ